MANSIFEGVEAAERVNERNPFNLILNRFFEAKARRMKEDQQRKSEEAELYKVLMGLSYKHDYDKELARIKAEERQPAAKNILNVIAGITSPESAFPEEEIKRVAPLTLGKAEGGEVLAPKGATFGEGNIYSSTGEGIGEYLPGYEPRSYSSAIPDMLSQFFGVTPQEAKRKALGLSTAGKTSEENIAERAARLSGVSTPQAVGGRIRVRLRATGQTGSIPENEFDPAIYERI